MCLNKSLKKNNNVFLNINDNKDTVYFNITLDGINFILHKLDEFCLNRELIFNSNNLGIVEIKESTSLKNLVFRYADLHEKYIVANVLINESVLYIFSSLFGMREFRIRLLSLKSSLLNNSLDDISYMIPEWGGKWLLNKQIIKDSYVICHLRLYGII